MDEVCGTCIYITRIKSEWTCGNEESEMCGIETEYDYYCAEWEGKNE